MRPQRGAACNILASVRDALYLSHEPRDCLLCRYRRRCQHGREIPPAPLQRDVRLLAHAARAKHVDYMLMCALAERSDLELDLVARRARRPGRLRARNMKRAGVGKK
jgi:hypothetical protein